MGLSMLYWCWGELPILTPPPITSVKTEMGSSPQHQYNMDSPITMDLTPLVNSHNIPQFELNLSPKCEPGLTTTNTTIPVSSFSLPTSLTLPASPSPTLTFYLSPPHSPWT